MRQFFFNNKKIYRMSSFLCFICHSTVNAEINEETRDKYREVVGINLCPDSQLCYICCHMLNKLSLFKSVCLKRSIEYPVLFREKGTLNLQKSDTDIHIVCPDQCEVLQQHNMRTYQYIYRKYDDSYVCDNQYKKLEADDYNDYFNQYQVENKDINDYEFDNNDNFVDNEWVEQNDGHVLNKSKENDDLVQYNVKNDSVYSNVNEINDNIIENNEQDNDEINKQTNEDNEDVIPKKTKKTKKKGLKKIILSLEDQKAELEGKRKEKKYLEAEYKCYNCALGFLFKDTYQAHMMRHEESNGQYSCPLCTLRVSSLTLLRAHTARHAERCVCSRCGARVTGPHHTCPHTRTRSLPCHMCASLFTDASGLQQHLKRVHTSKTSGRLHTCGVCGESYNTQGALRTHMIKHIKRKFPCDHCPATYSSPYTLSQHVKTHTSVSEAHYCVTCKAGFATRKSLLAHKRNTVNHQQTLFECPICTRMCPNQRALASHIQTVHSASKEYTCTVCPARYTSRKSLVRHVRTHTNVSRVVEAVCHLCGSRFKGNNKLNRHLREVCEKAKLEEQMAVY